MFHIKYKGIFLLLILVCSLPVWSQETIGSRCDLVVGGSPSVHLAFPSTVQAYDGSIYTYYHHGSDHYNKGGGRVVKMIQSTNNNGWCGSSYWTQPKTVFSVDDSDWNVDIGGAFIKPDGEIQLTGLESKWNGESWERKQASLVSVNNDYSELTTIGSYNLFPYGNGLSLDNGDTLISGYYGAIKNPQTELTGSGVLVSSDGGKTFPNASAKSIFTEQYNNTTGWGDDVGFCPTEIQLADLGNGELLAVTRAFHSKCSVAEGSEDYHLYLTHSKDYGANWEEKEYLSRGGPANILLLKNGHILMCYTYRNSVINSNLSSGIYCMTSDDKGRTWGSAHSIYENNTHWDFGYPQSIQMTDDTLFTTYYANNGSKDFRIQRNRFEEADLKPVATNLIKTSHFSGSQDWQNGDVIDAAGDSWLESASNWNAVPSGGKLRVSKKHVNEDSRANYNNNEYIFLEVLEPNDWMGINQTIESAYSSTTDGASMEVRFLAYSNVESEIYVSVEILGTDKRWVSKPVKPEESWGWHSENFTLPVELTGTNTSPRDIRLTIGFRDSGSSYQDLGIDHVTLRRRHK